MPVKTISTGRALMGEKPYDRRVLDTRPIAFWPQWELTGLTARCLVNPMQNATYAGVTLANEVGPFGWAAPFYDGVNDYCNIATATFRAAFQTAAQAGKFSLMTWGKVQNAGVWTDGAERQLIRILADGANNVYQRKAIANNRMEHDYNGAGTFDRVVNTPYSNTDWFCTITTLSDPADEMKGYWDGVQVGGTQAGIGLWAGIPNATQTAIGVSVTVPIQGQWHGWIGPVAIWDRALVLNEVRALSII